MVPITIKRILSECKYSPAFVFDIDGVLASYEYGRYMHNYSEHIWKILCSDTVTDPYQYARPFKTMQKFISKYLDNCYVCSLSSNEGETRCKETFITTYYNIPKEKMYFVNCYEEKLNILYKIQQLRKENDPHHIIMIEDTIKNLDYITDKSGFSTVHVSSFFD